MGEAWRGPERRRNEGAAQPVPRSSPVNALILTVIGVLLVTTAASVMIGPNLDDGTPHGRLLGVLGRVADAQATRHGETGRFTPWVDHLEVSVPAGVELTVVRGDTERWEALARDAELGLVCMQAGRWAWDSAVRELPSCYVEPR
ncbi:MAG: hypothetical protein P8177_14000 [Gemmatimonadota bacterium]